MLWRKQASIASLRCSGKSTDVLLIIAVLYLGSTGIRSSRRVVGANCNAEHGSDDTAV
jgi:hypothetical protein